MANLITEITQAGYEAAARNSNGKGFNVEISHIESVSNGRVMGRFPAKGAARSGSHIILQASVKSLNGEEYSFEQINLIESSGALFATVRNEDGTPIDSVTKYKNSILEYTLAYSLAEAGKITVEPIDASVFYVMMHQANSSAHEASFAEKVRYDGIVDNLDTYVPNAPLSAYQGAVLRNRLNQFKASLGNFSRHVESGNDYLGRFRECEVITFPDGKRVEKIVYPNIVLVDATTNEAKDGNALNSRLFHCPCLWGFKNRISNVYISLSAVSNDGVNESTGMNDGEPSRWISMYAPHKNPSDLLSVYLYFRKVIDAKEYKIPVRLQVTIEGY